MSDISENNSLSNKIKRLVEEKGWNQEEFARYSSLNRQTVRQILLEGNRTPRNSTVSACAKSLGVSVNDLRVLPVERLLAKIHSPALSEGRPAPKSLMERATQPQLIAWIERNPDRAEELSADEIDELLDLQQESGGGPLAQLGVEHFVRTIERKRHLIDQVHTIAGTEYIDLLEQLVDLIHDKIEPYRDRG